MVYWLLLQWLNVQWRTNHKMYCWCFTASRGVYINPCITHPLMYYILIGPKVPTCLYCVGGAITTVSRRVDGWLLTGQPDINLHLNIFYRNAIRFLGEARCKVWICLEICWRKKFFSRDLWKTIWLHIFPLKYRKKSVCICMRNKIMLMYMQEMHSQQRK